MLLETHSPSLTFFPLIAETDKGFSTMDFSQTKQQENTQFEKQETAGFLISCSNKDENAGAETPEDSEEDIVFKEGSLTIKDNLSRFYKKSSDSESDSSNSESSFDSNGKEEDDLSEPEFYQEYASSNEIIFEDSEEEKKNEKTIKLLPFWFGNEDKDQIKYIADCYYRKLNLIEEKKRCIRQPEPFVGRITRNKVENQESFTTLDKVEIYRRSLVSPGSKMPFVRTENMLTIWSFDEGFPLQISRLDNKELRAWRAQLSEDAKPSYLLCLPECGSTGYSYSVTEQCTEVTYSPDTLFNVEKSNWYEEYIPPELRKPILDPANQDDY